MQLITDLLLPTSLVWGIVLYTGGPMNKTERVSQGRTRGGMKLLKNA